MSSGDSRRSSSSSGSSGYSGSSSGSSGYNSGRGRYGSSSSSSSSSGSSSGYRSSSYGGSSYSGGSYRSGSGSRYSDDSDYGDEDKHNRLQRERPSRTLFIRNIPYETTEEHIQEMFGKYGEIKKVFNLISNRGMVFLSYYDLRHADAAKRELQDYELSGRKIDVHYSLPKEDNNDEDDKNKGTLFVTVRDALDPIENEALKKLFQQWGEIKEVRDCTGSPNQKFIECWDLRDSAKIVQERQGSSFAGGKLDIKFAYHSTPRSRSERHLGPSGSLSSNIPSGGGPIRSKYSTRQSGSSGSGFGSTGGGFNQIQTPLGTTPLLAQANPLALLAQAGLNNNVLNQVQLLSQMQQVANALGGAAAAQTPNPAVQQLATLLQLQQLQQLQQANQQAQAQAAVRPTLGTVGTGVGLGSTTTTVGQGYQTNLLQSTPGSGGVGSGNFGVY